MHKINFPVRFQENDNSIYDAADNRIAMAECKDFTEKQDDELGHFIADAVNEKYAKESKNG